MHALLRSHRSYQRERLSVLNTLQYSPHTHNYLTLGDLRQLMPLLLCKQIISRTLLASPLRRPGDSDSLAIYVAMVVAHNLCLCTLLLVLHSRSVRLKVPIHQ